MLYVKCYIGVRGWVGVGGISQNPIKPHAYLPCYPRSVPPPDHHPLHLTPLVYRTLYSQQKRHTVTMLL